MKRLIDCASLITLLVTFPIITMAQVDVDMNFNIGDPDYYGQVDLVENSSPQIVYSDPIIVQQVAPYMYYPPIYLRVPIEYYENWPQYCNLYNACYYPVFFVVDYWYLQIYAPIYHRHYPHGRPEFVPRVHYNGRGWYEHHYDNHRNIQSAQPSHEIRQNGQGSQPSHEIRQNGQGSQPLHEIRQNGQGSQPPQEFRQHVQGPPQEIRQHVQGPPQEIRQHIQGPPQEFRQHVQGPPHEIRQHVQGPPHEIRQNVQVVQPPHEIRQTVNGGQNREIRQALHDVQPREEHRGQQGGVHREER